MRRRRNPFRGKEPARDRRMVIFPSLHRFGSGLPPPDDPRIDYTRAINYDRQQRDSQWAGITTTEFAAPSAGGEKVSDSHAPHSSCKHAFTLMVSRRRGAGPDDLSAEWFELVERFL